MADDPSASEDPYDGKSTTVSKLHEVLTRLSRTANNEPMWRAWRAALTMPREVGILSVLRGVAALGALASAAREEIAADKDERAARAVLRLWPRVDALFQIEHFGSHWEAYASHLKEPLLSEMLHAHWRLRAAAPRSIPADSITELRETLARAKDIVTSDDGLDRSLKGILLELLSQSIRAIDDYEVFGTAAMEDSLTRTAVLYAKHKAVLDANSAIPAVKATLEATTLVAKVHAWTTKNTAAIALWINVGMLTMATVQALTPFIEGDKCLAITAPQLLLGAGETVAQ